MKSLILIDWQTQIVDEWFNSDLPGGFIKEVTSRNLYRKYDEIGITCVTKESAFKKKILMGNVLTWIKRRIHNLRSTIEGDAKVYVFRGCVPGNNMALTEGIHEYAKELANDDDAILRFGNRVGQRFLNISNGFIFDEKFFNGYFDELFDKCSETLDQYSFFQSEYLTFDKMKMIANGFFNGVNFVSFDDRNRIRDYIMSVDANNYFRDLFSANKMLVPEQNQDKSIYEFAENELLDYFKKTM